MKIIIFAGGTGKRFWPESRKESPKQFLPLINNTPLVKLRYDLLLQGFDKEDIFISTGKQYEHDVRAIIPDIKDENLILEPEMRDTGPAVTLAVNYVRSKYPEEVVSVQWSDHLIKKPQVFIESLKESEKIVKEENKIIFITVPARFPSPHRGYIKWKNKIKEYNSELVSYEFEKFVEKPTKEVAVDYINSGNYGWNPGYWIMPPNKYLDIVQAYRPEFITVTNAMIKDLNSDKATELFRKLEKTSADYLFAEKVEPDQAIVLLCDMGWSDVGEWIAFKEALQDSAESNVVVGNNFDLGSTDTLVFNAEDKKLIATIGLNGMVIVNTKEIVAVFHKEDNTRLKEFLKKMEEEGLEKYL